MIMDRDVKHAYVTQRRIAHPNYKPNKRWNEYWKKAADLCNEFNIAPDEFIRNEFEASHLFPTPAQICGPKARARAEEYSKSGGKRIDECANRAEFEADRLSVMLKLGKTVEQLMLDKSEPYSMLFRYCMLRSIGSDMAGAARRRAELQLRSQHGAREVYADILPEELK